MFDRFLPWLLKDSSSPPGACGCFGKGMHTGAVHSIAVDKDDLKQSPDSSKEVPFMLLQRRIITLIRA